MDGWRCLWSFFCIRVVSYIYCLSWKAEFLPTNAEKLTYSISKEMHKTYLNVIFLHLLLFSSRSPLFVLFFKDLFGLLADSDTCIYGIVVLKKQKNNLHEHLHSPLSVFLLFFYPQQYIYIIACLTEKLPKLCEE